MQCQTSNAQAPPRELTILRKHQESNTMLAIVMAGIAGLFILGIVVAYNYAASDSAANNPPATASAPAATTGSGTRAPAKPAATTGSGGAETVRQRSATADLAARFPLQSK